LLDGEPRFRRSAQLLSLRDLCTPRRPLGLQRGRAVSERLSGEQEPGEQADHRHRPPEAPQEGDARRPGHASFEDEGTPAVEVINRGPPMTARPIGQRRAMQRDFSSRMMLTRSP